MQIRSSQLKTQLMQLLHKESLKNQAFRDPNPIRIRSESLRDRCNALTNGEEKSLRHVAMVAKCLVDNKPKTSLKKGIRVVSNYIDLIQFQLICQMLAKFSGLESKRTISKLRKRERKFLCCVHLVRHKAGARN